MRSTSAAQPIGDYALLSDGQGAALVSRTGSIDWACLERFDAPSTFARILDADAGHWRLAPVGPFDVERSYLPGTMVLRTVFRTERGSIALTDALVFRPEERGHGIGQNAPHTIVRLVEGLEGDVEVEIEVAPRYDYGLIVPTWEPVDGGARCRGGAVGYVLSAPVPLEIDGGTARGRFPVAAGERLGFTLQAVDPWGDWPGAWPTERARAWLHGTVRGWESWCELHQSYEGPYAELVHHSGRVLQALTYAPTGAVIAAPTTSLPETIGGPMNWDYRYSWVRDASLTLNALWVAACPDEVERFFEFFLTAAGGHEGGQPLQILYGITGERRIAESELGHLSGYRGSAPVRVGNGAWQQEQLDVYGELLDAASVYAEDVGRFAPRVSAFLVAMADVAAKRWREPDHGIWEQRGDPHHHVYSKLMCWVALDRAVSMADKLGADDDKIASWSAQRDEIRAAILDRGWNEALGAFTQVLDGDALDASVLMLSIAGLLPGDDPRMLSTIAAIDADLAAGNGLLYRNRDQQTAGEGTFLLASFWMAHALALAGDLDAARRRFEVAAAQANDVGLFAEEVDARSGELLGNFPQAFSHIGLVNAAWAIACAEDGR